MTDSTTATPPTTPPLPPETQAVLDELLQRIAQARMPGDPPRPRSETPEQRAAIFQQLTDSLPTRGVIADDSRESIYD